MELGDGRKGAQKADTEQLHGAASLCRAAARAEHFHAASHARAIKQLGVEPWCTLHNVEVKSTLENMRERRRASRMRLPPCIPRFSKRQGSTPTRL